MTQPYRASRTGTESKPPPDRAHRPAGDVPAIRRCMTCRAKFRSDGWNNRMCDQCKRRRT